jgi:signal peptidase I
VRRESTRIFSNGGSRGGIHHAARHPVRRIGDGLLLFGVLVALSAAFLVTILPALAGASALTVRSTSMQPALPVGSVVVIRPRPVEKIAIGDVITFVDRDPASAGTRVVTHRVVDVAAGPAFRTKGDANLDSDLGLVAAADVKGVEWYTVPWVGWLAERITSWVGLLVVGSALLLVIGAHLLLPRHTAAGRVTVPPSLHGAEVGAGPRHAR